MIPLLFVAFISQGQISNSITYDFRDGGVIAGNGGSADNKLTLAGNYSQQDDTYGLDLKVDATISIQVDGSCTIRFLGSQYSGLDVKGTAVNDGDLGTQVGKLANDFDSFDFVYSGVATTLNFTTVAATGNDLYLPSIEVIPVQAGKDFLTAEKNIAYYFDLRDESIITSTYQGNIYEQGLFKIDAGCCNAYGYNGTQHGIIFKDGNMITLQVAGNSYIRLGGDQYSGGTITATSSTGVFDVASQAHATSTTYPQGADGGPWVDFLYVGTAGTVTLTNNGGTSYLPYIEISPVPYSVSLSSYVQKSGTITLNGVDINLTSGATASDDATINLSNGIVLSALKDTGSVAIDLGGQDLSTLTPSVSGDIASAVINGTNIDITFADSGTDPKTYSIALYDNSYFHGITTYDFRGTDGAALIAAGQSTDGLLTLSGTYAQHNNDPNSAYGLNMKVDSQINIQLTGSNSVRFLGSKYSGLNMEGTETAAGDLGTVSTTVTNDLLDTYSLVYSDPALKKGSPSIAFKAVAGTNNDIYLPKLDVIPAQLGAAYTSPVKNIPYYFDFRDGSIIPTATNGQSDISKGLVDVLVGPSNAYGYNGTQHGSILKPGNQIILQVAGNSHIKIGGSIYSSGNISVSSATGSFDTPSKSATTSGNFGNDGDTIDFVYAGTAGTVVLDFSGTTYVPYIEVSPIPYDVNLTPWVQKSGTISLNGTQIDFTSGADASEAATITLSAGTVFSTTNESASIEIDLGGADLSSFTPAITGDITSTSVNGNELTITFSDTASDPTSYIINISDSANVVTANPGETYIYNFADGSELPQTSYSSLRYETFKTSDGIVTINSNTTDQASQFGFHDGTHGGVFFPGNSFDMVVAGNATITFIVCQYGQATNAILEFKDINGNVIGSIPAQNIAAAVDGVPMNFSYSGPAGTITATLVSAGYPAAEIYLHGMSIENAAAIEPSNGKIDVWDFGAEQLDANLYNNKLDEATINAWYDSSITPGSASTSNILPSFSSGVLSWVGGSNDRLRTSNTNLTRYDENLGGVSDYTGRIYVNGAGATGRYMSLTLSEDDEVTLAMTAQNSNGNIHFTYVADPALQDDVKIVATSGSVTLIKFVAKYAGSYRIYDSADKPSYYRIERKDAIYKTLTGTVDVSLAPGIPSDYKIVFTNEAGKQWQVTPSGGTYTVDLPQDYTYKLSLSNANAYIISSTDSIELLESSGSLDVTIEQVELYTVTGNITGLGSEISNAVIHYTPNPDANKIFVPQPVVDNGTSTYSVQLEPNVEYTISAEGVNDYEIVPNTITIGNADLTADINFTPKPLYNVTINALGLDATQLSDLEITFSNLNEPDYNYNFTDITSVALRDGVYTMTLSGLDKYPLELALTSNLVVDGADTSKDLVFNPVTNWSFDDQVISNTDLYYKGLGLDGAKNEIAKGHLVCSPGNTITVPINPGDKMIVTYYYSSEFSIDGGDLVTTSSGSTSTLETVTYIYSGSSSGNAVITCSGSGTTYITNIAVKPIVPFSAIVTVGTDKDYQTIHEALNAIAEMDRPNNERVTVMIDPGNYEEMLVINSPNISLKNAGATPSIALLNKGVDIDDNAVRITSYYGHGYNYYSMGPDQKWHEDLLAVNKANGYLSYENKGSGTTNGSYWNATVVVFAPGFEAEDVIFENSFNQYISKKESEDIVVPNNGAPTGGERPTTYGDTSIQNRDLGYVERAAAIAFVSSADKAILNNCRVVGRQDSFYGSEGARVVIYKGAMMGAVDYIFGGMTAVFYKSDLVLNTSDSGNDTAYITAAQQGSSRGYLMYQCNVKSPIPGVETASSDWGKPGYFGRPWAATTSEVVFYQTNIDMSQSPNFSGQSMIYPEGWRNTLGGESNMMYERSTNELAGVDNSGSRASWSTVLTTDQLTDGTDITTFNFTKGNDDWDPIPALDAEEDSDYDGVPDVNDNCPLTANPDQADFNNNGIGDVCEDSDGDGILDSEDACPESEPDVTVDVFGCEVFELPSDNFSITTTSVTCNGENNGFISISAANTSYTYIVSVDGNEATRFTETTTIDGLAAGTYKVCITIEGRDDYKQCFNITIEGPTPLEAFSKVNRTKNEVSITLSGADSYNINHNGKLSTTSKSTLVINLDKGNNSIVITTDNSCQGKYSENIFVSEDVLVFPNPTQGKIQVYVNGKDTNIDVALFDLQGRVYWNSTKTISTSRIMNLDLANFSNGIYYLQLHADTVNKSIKIVKK